MITCKHGHLLRQIPCRECKKMDEDSALTKKQEDALFKQHEEIMKLREEVVLLKQRPTVEALNTAQELGKARLKVASLTTEVQVLRTVNDTLLAKLNAQELAPGTQTLGRRKRDALDAQMLAAQDLFAPPCNCPMCEARGA